MAPKQIETSPIGVEAKPTVILQVDILLANYIYLDHSGTKHYFPTP